MALVVVGLAMVFNTTAAEVLGKIPHKGLHYAVVKQVLYILFAALLAICVWMLGYEQLVALSGPFLIAGTALLILVFIPGIGQRINGAYRWLSIGSYSFQPSEFVKYLIPLYFIHKAPRTFKALAITLAQLAVPIGLILIEPDNGTVAIILAGLVALFILMRIRWVYWALPLAVLLVVGGAVAFQMPHVKDRIQGYIHPELDLKGKGHQPHQAKIAAGSGGVWGRGLGESLQKHNYLPKARSDYIAAIFGEEFGFVGISVLIGVYMALGYLGFAIAARSQKPSAFYTASILTFLICFQAFLNLGVVSGLLPSKGTNLPFFSQGGSGILANLMAICIILNIASEKKCPTSS